MSSGKILFTKSSLQSHNNLDVLTFDPACNLDWNQKITQYIKNIKGSNDRLAQNYKDLTLDNFLAVSVLLEGDEIRGFSSVWNRDFYPEDTVRIFNRWWEEKRKVSRVVCCSHTIATMEHQIQFAKSRGYKWAFFSRDRNRRVIKNVSQVLTKSTNKVWKNVDRKIAVCYPAAPSCWQWASFHAISEQDSEWGMLSGKIT